MRKRAATGRCEGRKPFGFREGERATIERMTALQAAGNSIRAITAMLNAEGNRAPLGGEWRDAVVGRILKSQVG